MRLALGEVDDGSRVDRGDLHRRVEFRGRGPADDDRDAEPAAFEFLANMDHLVERRGDQPAQADALCAPCHGFIDDALRFDHYAQVADLVAVAGHHHRDDVLADVVHVALDGGQNDAALAGAALALLGNDVLDLLKGALGRTCGLQQLRQEQRSLFKVLADFIQCGISTSLTITMESLSFNSSLVRFAPSFFKPA